MFNEAYYWPGTILATGETAVNSRDEVPHGADIQEGKAACTR